MVNSSEKCMFYPSVSIIVPIFNMGLFLKRCINSILSQSFKDYEVILVDDGSTDQSGQICDYYANTYEKISVIHRENGGLSCARLTGFELAKGKYILFVDSDDFIEPDMLKLLVESIENNQADLSLCDYYEYRDGKKQVVHLPYDNEVIQGRENILELYIKPLIGIGNRRKRIPGFMCIRLMRRELIDKAYFKSENEYYLEDHVFDLLYADHVNRISIVHTPLYYYCINSNSLTNKYREHKWKMYVNLLFFYISYIEDRKIENCQNNVDAFLFSALCSSIDNAVLSETYNSYKSEIRAIKNSVQANKIKMSVSVCNIPMTQRITYYLYHFRLYSILYFIRKNRLMKN